jgi:hypothetical protein
MSAWLVLTLFGATGNATLAADATIFADNPTVNGGAYNEFCVGNQGTTTTTRRGFVRFTLPAIPAGATITRVQLSVTQDNVRRQGGPLTATLLVHRALASWVEGSGGMATRSCGGGSADATGVNWNNQPSVALSPSASIDLPVNEPVTLTADTGVGVSSAGLLADVQGWVDGTFTNAGWRLSLSEEGTLNNARANFAGPLVISWTVPDGAACTDASDCTGGACNAGVCGAVSGAGGGGQTTGKGCATAPAVPGLFALLTLLRFRRRTASRGARCAP